MKNKKQENEKTPKMKVIKGNKGAEKKKEAQEKKQVNYSEYGYKPNQKVEVDINKVFEILLSFLPRVIEENTTVQMEFADSLEDIVNSKKVTLNPLAVAALEYFEYGKLIHQELVDKGVALHITELKKYNNDTEE